MKHKSLRTALAAVLLLLTAVYPGLMAMLSAAGWSYNVREGNYPAVFRSFAGWMYAGGALLCVGAILSVLAMKPRRWALAPASIGCAVAGAAACLSSLYRFCAYADAHFSGIGETMQPVSELYRDRLLPVLLPAVLTVALAIWDICAEPARDLRRERRAAEEAKAPPIVE